MVMCNIADGKRPITHWRSPLKMPLDLTICEIALDTTVVVMPWKADQTR